MGQSKKSPLVVPKDPPRKVVFKEGFWLGKYEVAQAQYETSMDENPSCWHLDVEVCSATGRVSYAASDVTCWHGFRLALRPISNSNQ